MKANRVDPLEAFRISFPYVKLFAFDDRIDYRFAEKYLADGAAGKAETIIKDQSLPLKWSIEKPFKWGSEYYLIISKI